MKYFIILALLLFSFNIQAAGFPINCSSALTYNTSVNSYGCNTLSSGITLGTSASVTNPQRSGDATTGLFSPATGTVDISISGTQEVTASSTGVAIGTTSQINVLDIYGGAVIGTTYAGVSAAPTNGLAVVGSVGIGTNTPTNDISLGGQIARKIWTERETTSNTAGNDLTIQSGGATSGATDKNSGNLILSPGISTGAGTSQILLKLAPATTSGTSDNAVATVLTLSSGSGLTYTSPTVANTTGFFPNSGLGISYTSGSAGSAVNPIFPPGGGAINFSAGTGGVVTGAASNNGGGGGGIGFTAGAGANQATTTAPNQGGGGGGANFTGGAGGNATGAGVANVGGGGGTFFFNGGVGGNANSASSIANTSGDGGPLSLSGGNAGLSRAGNGGTGGGISFTGGNGGSTSVSGTAGNGGSISFVSGISGTAGSGATAGSFGTISFKIGGPFGKVKMFMSSSGLVSIGSSTPAVSTEDIFGNLTIGTTYAGVNAAPTNGMIVVGSVGIGTSSPTHALTVNGTVNDSVDTLVDAAGTGLSKSAQTLNSNAVYQISFQPGLLTSVTNTIGVYGKVSKLSTVDNIECSAILFTCVGNPTITMYECGTSATCSGPTTIGTCTSTTTGTVVDGTVSNPTITAGDYVAWAISSGTCTSLDIAATAQVHSN